MAFAILLELLFSVFIIVIARKYMHISKIMSNMIIKD